MHYSLMVLIPKRVFKQYNLVIDDIINNAQIESLYLRKAMELYKEQPSNPNSKWDYYTINAFSIKKNDSDCDDSDIDDNSFEESIEDSDSLLCDYDANANVVDDFENDLGDDLDNDHAVPADDDQEKVEELKKLFKIYEQYEYIPAILSVKEFLENQYILKNWDDQKEAAYHRLWQLASGEDDPTEEEKSHDYYQFERNTKYYKSTYGNVENYIEFKKKYRTKAILTEQHGWVEESGDRIEKEYGDKFDSIIKSADPEDAVVLIDCHI